MNPTTERARERVERFTRTVDSVHGQWDAPSPCAGWTSADLVHHVIDTERGFLLAQGLVSGEPAPAADPAEAWHRHRRDVLDILGRDGVPETEWDGYFGPTTIGDTLADFYGWDLVLHSFDLARATGQDWTVDDAEAHRLTRTLDAWGAAVETPGMFGPPVDVPTDASPQDRLLGRVGRDPHRSP